MQAAVDHRAKQLRDDDKAMPVEERRSLAQARADAIVELIVKGGAVADGTRTATPTVTVTATLDDLEAGEGVGFSVDRRTVLPMNLCSLCRFHHGVAHKDGWKLHREADGSVVAVRRRDGLTLVDPPLPPPGTLPLVAA